MGLFRFNLIEVIPGIRNPVIYKLDKKLRFDIDRDSARVLQDFLNRTFSLDELALALGQIPCKLSIARKKALILRFVKQLEQNEIIQPSHFARSGQHFVSERETAVLNGRRLRFLGLELTDQCNFQCPHCSPNSGMRGNNHFMPLVFLHKVFNWAEEVGIEDINITGGEPFLHPGIKEVLDIVERTRIPCSITTNASTLTSDLVSRIASSNIRVRVSHYGSSHYYKKYAGSMAMLSAVENNIEALRSQCDDRMTVVVPVMRCNTRSEEWRIHFCQDRKIPYEVSLVSPFGRGKTNWKKVSISRRKSKRIQDEYRDYAINNRKGYRALIENSAETIHCFPCSMEQINLLADGGITPCLSIRQWARWRIDFSTDSPVKMGEVFNSSSFAGFQKTLRVNQRAICSVCEYKYDCGGGCPARAYSVFGTVNAPDPLCEHHSDVTVRCFQKMKGGK